MALYHLSVKIISRSNGQSACAAAAYRSGEKITSDFDGITHDYRNKQNVEYSVVMLPDNAPADFADRRILWNAVEQNEKQMNAQLAREIEFSLPRELSPEEQKKLALEFIKDNFVDEGMIADVNFHNPPQMNSNKKPIDANGNVTNDPSKYIYNNPHCHVLCTMRPMNDTGNWEPKKHKLYICEKDGIQKSLSPEELKLSPGWEKLYSYIDKEGHQKWYTKSYVQNHPEEELSLKNRYPKCIQEINPKIENWNSVETLMQWRCAWADKVNEVFAEHNMVERIDHRSYKEQGIDLIPTIHEGKSISIQEKRFEEEYKEKIARGDKTAVRQHTEIRMINNSIREHNSKIRIIEEMQNLRIQLENIMKPARERLNVLYNNISERLENLRCEIICVCLKIHNTTVIRNDAYNKIKTNNEYLKDLNPSDNEYIEEIKKEIKNLKQIDSKSIWISPKKHYAIQEKIERLTNYLSLNQENVELANKANSEITLLKKTVSGADESIEIMKNDYSKLLEYYRQVESLIEPEHINDIGLERLSIRSTVEQQYITADNQFRFTTIANKVDDELSCSINHLSGFKNVDGPKNQQNSITLN